MVALLVRLKLSLLRNMMRQSAWRLVGVLVGLVTGLGFLVVGVIAIGAARLLPVDQAGLVVILGGSALMAGWIVVPLALSGTDETLDPSRFALLPLSARQLLPGLLAAGAVGVPGLVTIGVSLATVVTWSRGPGPAFTALICAALGVLICLLSARVLTCVLADLLNSRRFKDVASVIMVLVFMGFALAFNAVNALTLGSPQNMKRAALDVADVVAWTPLGWAWSAPLDVASGAPLVGLAKVALSAALVIALTVMWHHFLALRLTSSMPVGGTTVRTGTGGSLLERYLPPDAVGATAAKCLRYWRHDPRYIASISGVLLAPAAVTLASVVNTGVGPWLVWMPVVLAFVVGTSTCQDISYDGSAFWTQISCGIEGRGDLAGRALAVLVWSLPLFAVSAIGLTALTDAWAMLPQVFGLGLAVLFAGVGVGVWVTAHWQGPAPPPGANPMSSGGGTSFESFIAVIAGMALSVAVTLPIAAIVIGGLWVPALN